MAERNAFLFRMDPILYNALARWAGDELRSLNGQLEYLLRDSLRRAGRLPGSLPSDGEPRGGDGAESRAEKDTSS